MSAQQGVGLREFGRSLDVSGEAIRKAIKSQRIPAKCVGEKALSSGRLVPVIIDPEGAALAFRNNTNASMSRDGAMISEAKRRGRPPKNPPDVPRETIQTKPPAGLPPIVDPGENVTTTPTINESRMLTEHYKSKIAQLEYEEKVGLLVRAEEIKTGLSTLVTAARTKMLGVPTKAKGRIPHLTLDDLETIGGLIREALEDLANGV